MTLSVDKIMDIIYHSMPNTWKNKMIEQGFIYADFTIKEMTDFFETRGENLESKEIKKKSSVAYKKSKKVLMKRKRKHFDSSVVGFSDESTKARRPTRPRKPFLLTTKKKIWHEINIRRNAYHLLNTSM